MKALEATTRLLRPRLSVLSAINVTLALASKTAAVMVTEIKPADD